MALAHLDITDGVATVTLDDPTRRNAMTLAMCDEVEEILDRVDADPNVGAIVVTGAGKAFSAGADLSHLGGSTDVEAAEGSLMAIYQGFLRFGRSPLPTIAAVNGAAVGAGMNLALICDVRLAARKARFDVRFMQLGIHPGGGHTWMFQNITTPQTAAAAILFSDVMDGEEAARVGLAHRCVDDGQLLPHAQEMAARAAAAPRDLIIETKKSLAHMRSGAITTQDAAVAYEVAPQAHSTQQPEFQARLAELAARISSKS